MRRVVNYQPDFTRKVALHDMAEPVAIILRHPVVYFRGAITAFDILIQSADRGLGYLDANDRFRPEQLIQKNE